MCPQDDPWSEHGPRTPEEQQMLRDQGAIAVPNPAGPTWWDVFWRDPLGELRSATVKTFEGAAGAAAAVVRVTGEAAGAASGSFLEGLGLDRSTALLGLLVLGGLAVVLMVRR
jgi:hypothetical protein